MTENKRKPIINIPPVSVCMSMYNASKYLRECIDSVLAQTFTDFEFLIVDDGSTDDSVEIVQSYHDSRIRLIKNKHDYIGSLNILLDEARGKYIARMDADDVMMPERLKIQFEYMEVNQDVDILGGAMVCFGNIEEKFIYYSTQPITVGDLLNGPVISHPTVMMRAKSVSSLRYESQFAYAEDYRFWCQAIKAGLKIISTRDIVHKYRFEGQNVSCTHSSKQREAALSAKADLEEWITEHESLYANEHDVPLSSQEKKLTVIVTFLNEGVELERTVAGIRNTAGDSVDVLVINDCSYDGYPYGEHLSSFDVRYVVNRHRLGVAASRDLGVELCKTPYFLLLDAHMRFYDGKWPRRIVSLLDKDDRVIISCQTRFLVKDETDAVVHNTECPDVFGAFSTFSVDKYWPDIEWNLNEQQIGQDIEPVGNILGAGYAASKRYWSYIKGLQGLRKYGCDEAFLSFKVWREGGKCLLVKDLIIGHIYRTVSPYQHYMPEEISNNLLVSYLTFSQSYYCYASAIALKKDRDLYFKSMRFFQIDGLEINKLKSYLDSIYTKSFDDVLQIHRCRLYGKDTTKHLPSLYHQINKFILSNPLKRLGLFEGMAGQLLWFCLYNKWNNGTNLDDIIQNLWNDICDAVRVRSLSWNFSQGIAGIGWAFMYLYSRQLLDTYPEDILYEIDMQLQEVDLNRVTIPKFAIGAGGILAYITSRMTTGQPNWGVSYLENLGIISKRIIEDPSSDTPSVFYAMYYLDMQKNGIEKNTYRPRVSEWLIENQHLPLNKEYWEPTIFNGCIGAVIGLIDNECNNKSQVYV